MVVQSCDVIPVGRVVVRPKSIVILHALTLTPNLGHESVKSRMSVFTPVFNLFICIVFEHTMVIRS